MLLALATTLAHAGACCAGSTTTTPAMLGECEGWLVGLGVSGEVSAARWDHRRALADSSLAERAGLASLVAGGRWDRRGSVTVELPVRLDHRAAGEVSAWGGGVGDVRALVWWDPFVERPKEDGGGPLPWFVAGLRAPTGRDWTEARQPLDADVTGLAGPGLLLGATLGRTLDRTPWTVGLDAEIGLGGEHPQTTLTASGSVGRTLGARWTVLGSARHAITASGDDGMAARTAAGARLVLGRPVRWRAWAGAEADLPVPGLGRSAPIAARLGVGAALVR